MISEKVTIETAATLKVKTTINCEVKISVKLIETAMIFIIKMFCMLFSKTVVIKVKFKNFFNEESIYHTIFKKNLATLYSKNKFHCDVFFFCFEELMHHDFYAS